MFKETVERHLCFMEMPVIIMNTDTGNTDEQYASDVTCYIICDGSFPWSNCYCCCEFYFVYVT